MMIDTGDQLSKAVLEKTGGISSQTHLLVSTVGWELSCPWRQQEEGTVDTVCQSCLEHGETRADGPPKFLENSHQRVLSVKKQQHENYFMNPRGFLKLCLVEPLKNRLIDALISGSGIDHSGHLYV